MTETVADPTTLDALVREVAADHPDSNPRELAGFVAKLTPQEDLIAFYADALVDRVRHILGDERRGSMVEGSNRSPKLEQRRDWWREMLVSRVHVGGGNWKQIGECTIDDLTACITERQQNVERLGVQIENFKRLAKLMASKGARIVSDLPPQANWSGKK